VKPLAGTIFTRVAACLLLCFALVSASHAVIETYQFSDDALAVRYRQLSAELRCPKCQNQNIAASNAPIAQDLRKLLYKQLEAGASDEEILQYMVSRYGEFVRYRPRFGGVTLLLWLAPLVLLLGALAVVFSVVRGARNTNDAFSEQEQQQLDELLEDER